MDKVFWFMYGIHPSVGEHFTSEVIKYAIWPSNIFPKHDIGSPIDGRKSLMSLKQQDNGCLHWRNQFVWSLAFSKNSTSKAWTSNRWTCCRKIRSRRRWRRRIGAPSFSSSFRWLPQPSLWFLGFPHRSLFTCNIHLWLWFLLLMAWENCWKRWEICYNWVLGICSKCRSSYCIGIWYARICTCLVGIAEFLFIDGT